MKAAAEKEQNSDKDVDSETESEMEAVAAVAEKALADAEELGEEEDEDGYTPSVTQCELQHKNELILNTADSSRLFMEPLTFFSWRGMLFVFNDDVYCLMIEHRDIRLHEVVMCVLVGIIDSQRMM